MGRQNLRALQRLRRRLHRLDPAKPLRDVRAATAFVRERRIVLTTGRSSLPMLAEAIAGREIRGSWMADPAVFPIYDLLGALHRLRLFVTVPLILGKETMLVSELAPCVERLAADAARTARARTELSPLAVRLLREVEQSGEVRMDRWAAPAAAGRKARLELVRALLVASRDFHTEAGYHTAVVIPWRACELSSRFKQRAARLTYEKAVDRLVLAALRSAVTAPEREVRRWLPAGAERMEALLASGHLRRMGAYKRIWLTCLP